jgi:hypothetical protein
MTIVNTKKAAFLLPAHFWQDFAVERVEEGYALLRERTTEDCRWFRMTFPAFNGHLVCNDKQAASRLPDWKERLNPLKTEGRYVLCAYKDEPLVANWFKLEQKKEGE